MLEFRPHHFLCTVGFEGKGYSPEFVEGYRQIASRLRDRPDGVEVPIRVVGATDSICAPCPNRRETLCTSQPKIEALDEAHRRHFGFEPGLELTWGEARSRIVERMNESDFDRICAPCGWRELGICQAALRRLKQAVTAVALFVALIPGMPSPSHAAKAKRKPAAEASKKDESPAEAKTTQDPPTIDAARSTILKKRKSRDARAVKAALEAFQSKRYDQARKLAQPLQGNGLYGDYGYKIAADASLAEAESQSQSRQFAKAQSDAQRALDAWLQIQTRHPGSPLLKDLERGLAQSEIMLGDANHGQSRWKPAIQAYERAFQRSARSNHLLSSIEPEVLGRYAESCKKAKSLLCDAWIQRFVSLHPKSSAEIQAILAHLPSATTRAPARRPIARLTQAYKAPDLDQTALDAALELYRKRKYDDAIEAFEALLQQYPKSAHRFRARYWLGQALAQDQEHEKARKVHEELLRESPLSYYGLMASISTGIAVDPRIDASLPVASNEDPALLPSETLRLRRAEEFIVEGAPELAAIELRELKPRDALSDPFLMYLAALNADTGNHNSAFQLLQELIQRGYEGIHSSYGVRLIFPTRAYLDEIRKHATEAGLDPILVLSLIKQESAFDHSATSSAGASGLMQLMPSTARELQAGLRTAELTQVETNLRLGTRYLKKVSDRFNGNIAMALASYNAGPNAVARWVREGKAERGILEFIEAIPYKETREYVGAILRNYSWYSMILTGERPQGLSYFWNVYGPPGPPATIPLAVEAPTAEPQEPAAAEAETDESRAAASGGP